MKDVLAMLRFAQNPRDCVAGFRLMQLLPGVLRFGRAARQSRIARQTCGRWQRTRAGRCGRCEL
ncbi:hypothetical protein MES5069_660013 [Mesorhizobium escarrei]|uniref:Uncharacterized protein n=1 Tax=Mesorhizobium escarrei TaxID=666018 RepID=A0ABM9EFR3_9HYPH|nr:hypothetical protein MES5069_660013 [Mesorhizobium escarrei]